MGDTYPVTKKGYEDLKRLLHEMKTIDRPKVILAIAEARGHGDLSENAEYDAAKEKQSHLEGRIADLEHKVATANVIDPSTIQEDKIVFGATVTLLDLDSDQKKTYMIVSDSEANLKLGSVSVNSPIARALIGKRAGDFVEFETANGVRELEILRIEYK
jgi:transcription elongation factor GreA